MNTARLFRIVFALSFALAVRAQAVTDGAKTSATPPMDPAMAEAMKMGSPSENHKVLDPLVGKWATHVVMWMAPGGKAEESMGTSVNSWIFGGRFLKQEYKGDYNGQPFEGMGLTGYDNLRAEYQSLWLDNMSTGIMQSAGTYTPATKTITTAGSFSCPMTKEKERSVRSELKILSNDKNTYTSYFKTPEGKEFKAMEITYTRAK